VGGVAHALASGPAAAPSGPTRPTATTAAAGPGGGYWLVSVDGNVYPFGAVPALGSLGATPPARPITGASITPSGAGYWLVGTDGGIFSFGDARFLGSTGALRLNKPVVGMAATPSSHGYWLVASDGGIFSFGDAGFFGSTGALRLNKPVVGMAATPSGRGYWLVASDGGIFAFGDAGFYGSTGALSLNKPITGMSASPSGRGYRFVATDGGLFSFGDAAYAGSAVGRRVLNPIVGMAASPTGNGYWLVGSSGSIYAFGDVSTHGSTSGNAIPAPIVAIAAPPPPAGPGGPGAADAGPSGPTDDDAPAPAGPDPAAAPPPAAPPAAPFQIALIGDTEAPSVDDPALLRTRSAINGRGYAFVVHDGDVQDTVTPCSQSRLLAVRDLFNGFSAPFIYTPGDNEWSDCSDPATQLDSIRQVFFSTDQSLGQHHLTLSRQAAPFVENARWVYGNVVFATINAPGSAGTSSSEPGLTTANVAWVNAAFDQAVALGSPAVMIIQQDDPFDGPENVKLDNTIVGRARDFGKPVVLVHGDTHVYRLDRPWGSAPNLIELETFASNQPSSWVQVAVDPASPSVFKVSTPRS